MKYQIQIQVINDKGETVEYILVDSGLKLDCAVRSMQLMCDAYNMLEVQK